MQYLIRFVQMHETFRQPETDSLAEIANIKIDWKFYSNESPFAIVELEGQGQPEELAAKLLKRSILAHAVFELWGGGANYDRLHRDVRERTSSLWGLYREPSFRFHMDSFQGTRSLDARRDIYESFSYMDFQGPITMSKPDNEFHVFEDYELNCSTPKQLYLGRLIGEGARRAITTYNLKKRTYIATTSMDAELALVTANIALTGPGKVAYDPFMGTGSFPVACGHFGAAVFGSDMDGRSIRGKGPKKNVAANFKQYGISSLYLGGFVADLTNTPLRVQENTRYIDAIVCDPPYGVREGLKVLGSTRVALQQVVYLADGTPAHLGPNYVPPKKAYSFTRLLDDVLDFSSTTLVDGGRLCMWMPVAGLSEEDELAEADVGFGNASVEEKELNIPAHPALELVSTSTQDFNKWSRRLLCYKRRADVEVDIATLLSYRTDRDLALQNMKESELGNWYKRQEGEASWKKRADDLNDFRRKYFLGFKERPSGKSTPPSTIANDPVNGEGKHEVWSGTVSRV